MKTAIERQELVLEALIFKAGMNPVMQGSCYVMHPEALQAVIDETIKQARAQPAPVQEPVAWMRKLFSPELGEFFDYKDGAFARETDSDGWTPLYTASPAAQRQPLTDEQKRELIKKSELWDMHIHIGWYSAPAKSFVEKAIQLISEIEAAHGIKGNT